jgi:hypothetical protein
MLDLTSQKNTMFMFTAVRNERLKEQKKIVKSFLMQLLHTKTFPCYFFGSVKIRVLARLTDYKMVLSGV